jgi:low temperature requirement protein LtrA
VAGGCGEADFEQLAAGGGVEPDNHELHGHDDAHARSTFLLQILVLVAMAAFIPEAGGARGAAFAVAAGVLFAVLAVSWLLAARGDRPEYRRTSGLFVTGTAACAVVLAATALLPASARVLAGRAASRGESHESCDQNSPSRE